ncbi:MAG: LytR family transcriptional regulator [Frankiales bacterium]|nr:LytR family transcriptional regulator [Frankiales bacterium]
MTSPDPGDGAASGRPHIGRRVLAVASVMTVVATTICGAGWMSLNHLTGNITTIDVTGELGTNRPTKATPSSSTPTEYQAMNILVMGTDTRTGQGSGYGSAATTASGNGHSDTTILVHISADRQHILAVSIPRDSVVTRPLCKGTGMHSPDRINTAFAEGGAGCAIKAVEYLTGDFIDHYVVVDFKGFKSVVDALGGVEVCLTTAVNDPKSHLDLSAGKHLLTGDQALAFARVRHNIGDGSDIGRIGRQQDFLSSIVRAVTNKGMLADPVKLYNVLSAVTDSLTTDPEMGTLDFETTLATSLSSISPSNVTFVTVPWTLNSDGATLSWNTQEADKIWSAIKNDTVYGKDKSSTTTGGKPLTVAPSAIQVKVLNGTGVTGAAAAAAQQLKAIGFVVTGLGNTSSPVTTSSITAPKAYTESLRTLSYSTGISSTTLSGSGRVLTVTVGPDWAKTLKKVTIATPGSTTGPAVKTANQNICSS